MFTFCGNVCGFQKQFHNFFTSLSQTSNWKMTAICMNVCTGLNLIKILSKLLHTNHISFNFFGGWRKSVNSFSNKGNEYYSRTINHKIWLTREKKFHETFWGLDKYWDDYSKKALAFGICAYYWSMESVHECYLVTPVLKKFIQSFNGTKKFAVSSLKIMRKENC